MTGPGSPLADEINEVMQQIIGINARWPGDYALFVQSSCTAEDTVTHYEWYFKPPMAGAKGEMAGLAERPPGYEDPLRTGQLEHQPGNRYLDELLRLRVRALRKKAGISQGALADEMTSAGYRMHQTAIAKIEAGTRPVTVSEGVALAVILGVSLADLIADPDATTQPEGEKP